MKIPRALFHRTNFRPTMLDLGVTVVVATVSPPSSQELLDRVVDSFLVSDLRERQVFFFLESLFELAIELARSVRAFDLAVAEEVALGEELVAEQADAVAVVFPPVVAVREVEDVDVPVDLRVLVIDDLVGEVISRADPRAAAFA